MIELLHSTHWWIRWDVGRRLVVMVRTPSPFGGASDIDASFIGVHAALGTFTRATTALLVDLREGAARNDAEFETKFGEHRRRMLDGFAKVAVVVRTATGRLQVQRHLAEDKIVAGVFVKEDEALAYLGRPSMIPAAPYT